jgi:serine/threonine protein kinase
MINPEEIEEFKILDVLGAGAHGMVYRAINKTSGQFVAIKHLNRDLKDIKQAESESFIQNELRFLREIAHDNVIGMVKFIQKPKHLMMVIEYMEGGAVNQVIDKLGPLSEDLTKVIIRQVLLALEHLHSKKIIHRDIKVKLIPGGQYSAVQG